MDKYLYIKDLFEKNKHQENAIKMSQYMKIRFYFMVLLRLKEKIFTKNF